MPLLLGSILLNFSLGRWLSPGERATDKLRQTLLLIGVSLNLLALSYFKYTGFIFETINVFTAGALRAEHIVLPLAISFFTITQIAYLVFTPDSSLILIGRTYAASQKVLGH